MFPCITPSLSTPSGKGSIRYHPKNGRTMQVISLKRVSMHVDLNTNS